MAELKEIVEKLDGSRASICEGMMFAMELPTKSEAVCDYLCQ